VAALARGLLAGHDHRTNRAAGCREHGGVDGRVIVDMAVGKLAAHTVDVERDHANSRRKLMSMARAECVMAPDETKSAPVSA